MTTSTFNTDTIKKIVDACTSRDFAKLVAAVDNAKEKLKQAEADVTKFLFQALSQPSELLAVPIPPKPISERGRGKGSGAKTLESSDAAGEIDHSQIKYVFDQNSKGSNITQKTIARTLGVESADVLAYLRKFPEDFALKRKGSHYYVTPRFTLEGNLDIAHAKELEEILSEAEGKKLNRKGFIDLGYNLKSAIAIAKADSTTFGFKQNKAQGEVWLK